VVAYGLFRVFEADGRRRASLDSRLGYDRHMSRDRVLDPEGAHAAAARQLTSFEGRRVLEIGCGEGRLTYALAGEARSWRATEPDAASVRTARRNLPRELRDKVKLEVVGGTEVRGSPGEFDLVFFSWSL